MSGHKSSVRLEAKKTKILDLPTELLQHIASFLPCNSVLEMRLACKTLECITMDTFAKEYISYQESFMLDPARLLRVKNILSTPHLAARVRTVLMTFCATDSPGIVEIAPEEGQDYEQARNNWLSKYEMDQHDKHLCKIEALSNECEALLGDVISKVALNPKCSIVIDVQSEDEVYRTVSKRRPQLMKEILQMALHAGCNVNGLKLVDDFALKASHFQLGGAFEGIIRGVREFSYVTLPESDDDLETAWNQQHWQVMAEVLQKAQNLQDFHLLMGNPCAKIFSGMALCHLCSTTFATARLSCLSELRLCGIIVSNDALTHMLNECRHSLTICRLQYLGVIGWGDVWEKLTKLLGSMPRLKTMCLSKIYKRSDEVSPQEARKRSRPVRFVMKGEEAKKLAIEMEEHDEEIDPHPFLENVIGIRYEPWS